VTNHASNSADSVPSSAVRPKHLSRTERADAAESLCRAAKASGITNADLGRSWGTSSELARSALSGHRAFSWEKALASPRSFRLALAGELTADEPTPVETSSGLLRAVSRVGRLASAIELVTSPHSDGGSAITAEEQPAVLREIDGALESLRALRASIGRGT
jgi:hypothetical protein